MAKRISQVQRVLNTDVEKFEKMTRAELAHEVSILASAANKRIKRLEAKDYNTPALRYTMEHGGKFSVKGKSKTQLLTEMKRAKGFIAAKTSTVSGAKKSIKTISKAIKKTQLTKEQRELPEEEQEKIISKMEGMTKEEIDKYWEAVDRLRKLQPVQFNEQCLQYTGKIQNYIEKGRTSGQIASYINRSLKKAQSEEMKKQKGIEAEIEKYYKKPIGGNELDDNNI